MPSNHLILCHPLLLPPSIFPSTRVFSNESARHIRWPKYWGFSFNVSPSNEHSGLISFRMDWLDLLAVQGILNSLLQHHSSKASILQHSAFFIVQLSSIHDYWKKAITSHIQTGSLSLLPATNLYQDSTFCFSVSVALNGPWKHLTFGLPYSKTFLETHHHNPDSNLWNIPILPLSVRYCILLVGLQNTIGDIL